MALVDSAVQLAPGRAETHFARGRILSALKRPDEARAAYEQVLSLDPAFQGVWFNLGHEALRRGQQRQALRLYQKELGQLQRHAKASSPRSASSDPRGLPAVWLQIGRAYEHLGVVDSAHHAYEQAIAADPELAVAYRDLAHLYERQGELDKALVHAKRALELDSLSTDYRFRVGSLLLRTGQPKEAATELEEALKQHPWHYGTLYNLSQALVRLNRAEEAQQYLAKADSAQALQHQISQAQATVDLHPEAPERWVELADLLHRAHRFEEAITAYRRALHLDPKRPAPIWFNLGVGYANAGNLEAARQAWENVLQYDPDHEMATSYLGKLSE